VGKGLAPPSAYANGEANPDEIENTHRETITVLEIFHWLRRFADSMVEQASSPLDAE